MNLLPAPSRSGFTLIEVLVITGITVILLLSASAIFMTFLLNQSLVTQKQKIKIDGDNALKQITQVLREARTIENCAQVEADEAIVFSDILGNQGEFYITDDRLASESALQTVYLTSDDLRAFNFSANCSLSQDSYLVKIQFSLADDEPSFSQNPLQQTFEANVSLRN